MSNDEPTLLTQAAQLAREFGRRAAEYDRSGQFPVANLESLRQAGFFRLTLPAAFGGLGADLATAARVLRLLGAGDASTALVLTQHLAAVGAFAWLGSPRCQRFLREEVAHDRFVGLFAGTPEFEGRAPTVASRDPAAPGWRLNGRKGFASGCRIADWAVVPALAQGADGARESLTCLVRLGSTGVQLVESWDTIGLRASESHDIVFVECFVPEGDILARTPEAEAGPRPGGQNLATGFFSFGLAFFAALYLGVADAALACLHETLVTRQPLGRAERLLDSPPTRFAFAELMLQHRAAAAMLEWAITRHREPGQWTEATFPDLVATKDVVTRAAVEIVQRAFQLAGGVALWRRLPFERYLRDVQGGPLHPLNHVATLSLFGTLAAEDRRGSVLGWSIH